MKIALAQLQAVSDWEENCDRIVDTIATAAADGAELVVFPEAMMRNFAAGKLADHAQPIDGPFASRIRQAAAAANITAVVGMFTPAPTRREAGEAASGDNDADRPRVYNVALVTGPDVHEMYRKIYRYDAHGFTESATVAAGSTPLSFSVGGVTVGVAICYDLRFPELFVHLAQQQGCQIIVVPASFSDGPGKVDQYRLLHQARALDSTCVLVGCDQPRPGGKQALGQADGPTGVGHSLVVAPDGRILAELGADETVDIVDVPVESVATLRESLPVLQLQRAPFVPPVGQG
ncbi:carbon-nitrogen hydrolase family protein [Corynebacterium choanae]|nr:carbon-nitrogen hydrolase family protein [Corynebacterium choanae]